MVVRLLDMEGLVKLAIEPFLAAVMVQNAYVLVMYRSAFLGASLIGLYVYILPHSQATWAWWKRFTLGHAAPEYKS